MYLAIKPLKIDFGDAKCIDEVEEKKEGQDGE